MKVIAKALLARRKAREDSLVALTPILPLRIQPSPSWQGQLGQQPPNMSLAFLQLFQHLQCVRGDHLVPIAHMPIEGKEFPFYYPEEKNTINFLLPLCYLFLREWGGLIKPMNLVVELSTRDLRALSLFFWAVSLRRLCLSAPLYVISYRACSYCGKVACPSRSLGG